VQNLDVAGTDWYLKLDLMPKWVQEMSAKKALPTYSKFVPNGTNIEP